jgi:predicted dehydrogenase
VLLDYGSTSPAAPPPVRALQLRAASPGPSRVRLGVVGAGGFFRAVHLPILAKHQGFEIRTIASRTGLQLRDLAQRHNIPSISTASDDVINDREIDAVLIATRHDLHADLATRALAAGKHVFVEKPLGLTVDECERVLETVRQSGRLLAVGFNRRFSPHAVGAKALIGVRDPKTVLYRVNAGVLPAGHWLRDPVEGGGRLIGEGVHFFDLMRWFVDADPVDVDARALTRSGTVDPDNVVVSIGFADGSTGVLAYLASGDPGLGKERVEIFAAGRSLVIDDYRSLEVHGVDTPSQRTRVVEKGHKEILDNFCLAIRGQQELRVSAQDGLWATWCAEQAVSRLVRSRDAAAG